MVVTCIRTPNQLGILMFSFCRNPRRPRNANSARGGLQDLGLEEPHPESDEDALWIILTPKPWKCS